MNEMTWIPFVSLLTKEIRRFLKVIVQTVLSPMVNSALYLLIFGVSLGSSMSPYKGFPYIAFLIPGLIMMTALNNSYQNSSSSIVGSKFHGDLQDLRVAPLSHSQVVWALSLGALVRGLVVSGVVFVMSEIYYFIYQNSFLPIAHPFALLTFLGLGCLCFAQFGIWVGFWSKSFEHVNAIGSFILLPLLYLGGVFVSIEHLHPFWQGVAQLNPMLYFINGVRYGILGIADVDFSISMSVTFFTFVGLHFLAARSVKYGSYGKW